MLNKNNVLTICNSSPFKFCLSGNFFPREYYLNIYIMQKNVKKLSNVLRGKKYPNDMI